MEMYLENHSWIRSSVPSHSYRHGHHGRWRGGRSGHERRRAFAEALLRPPLPVVLRVRSASFAPVPDVTVWAALEEVPQRTFLRETCRYQGIWGKQGYPDVMD